MNHQEVRWSPGSFWKVKPRVLRVNAFSLKEQIGARRVGADYDPLHLTPGIPRGSFPLERERLMFFEWMTFQEQTGLSSGPSKENEAPDANDPRTR